MWRLFERSVLQWFSIVIVRLQLQQVRKVNEEIRGGCQQESSNQPGGSASPKYL